jgi:hypothetical protein
MTYGALRLTSERLRRPVPGVRRSRRLAQHPGALSVAGLVGVPVRDGASLPAGRLADVVVRWDSGADHPPVVGVIVRAQRRRHYVTVDAITGMEQDGVTLRGSLPDTVPHRKPDLVALVHDVLDRQLVDIDGVDVVRVSDLVLADHSRGVRLVGVDVSLRTVLRRLGPASMRRTVAQDRLYDWSGVVAFAGHRPGVAGATLQLNDAVTRLRELPPSDLDVLLGDLSQQSGRELAEQLDRQSPS